MDSEGYTLEELSELSGFEPRTIRLYVQGELVPRPDRRGRGARYPAIALARLHAIRTLKDRHRMSLDEIGQILRRAPDELVRRLSEGDADTRDMLFMRQAHQVREMRTEMAPADAESEAAHAPRSGAHRPRLASTALRRAMFDSDAGDPEAEFGTFIGESPVPGGSAALERLLLALRRLGRSHRTRRRARAETWVHVRVTRDLVLRLREPASSLEVHQLEEIADSLRSLLTHGGADAEDDD